MRASVWGLVSIVIVCSLVQRGRSEERLGEGSTPLAAVQRVPWSSSNFRGRPEPPPPFRAEALYPHLRFRNTTILSSAPGTSRLFLGEREGKVFVLPVDRQATTADLFLDTAKLVDRRLTPDQPEVSFEALYGLAFDPEFEKNRFCYVCYVVRRRDGSGGQLPDGTRVSRFRVSTTDPPRCEPESEQLIIAWLQGGHNGGCLKFGPDGCLYVSTGDGSFAFPPDGRNAGQDMTTLLSKILRIDVRGSTAERPYTIPADNPFVALDGARGETWAYGLRNPWKMSFDRQTGSLWVGDVGWELWELVYRVRRGDNFGWSIVEGSQPVHTERQRGPTPIVPATLEIPHTDGASITGGFVYRGRQFPELVGHYIFGDWETRRIWGMDVDREPIGEKYELIDPTVRIVDFAEDAAGELYLLDHDDGAIYTLARNERRGEESPFPRRLSETGLFADVAGHRPAAGVLPFAINVEQWSDEATAERWLGIPGDGVIHVRPKATPVAGSQFSRAMDFPLDTVLVKTLSLELEAGNPASRRRIETQTLHFDGREWQGYTFEWNDQGTDATLVERAGKNRVFTITDPRAPDGKRQQTWRFSARNECIRCHNPWSEYALAFNTAQLNRPLDGDSTGENQIAALQRLGIWADVEEPYLAEQSRDPVTPRSPEQMARLTPPFDESQPVAQRARSYLHVNCGHCHRFNGGGSSYIYLQHDLPLRDTKAIGIRPTQGTFGIHDARLIAPGDPHRSVLYFRLSKTGPGHMPHLGAKRIDDRALRLVHDWIQQLPARLEDVQRLDRLIELDEPSALAKELADAPRNAWVLARRLARREGRDSPNEAELIEGQQQDAAQRVAAVASRRDERDKLTNELLALPTRALLLTDALRENRLPPSIRDLVMERALQASTDAAVRDLFEAFVPEERRTQRLGDVINPAELLKLTGDVERGRQLFQESTVVLCRNCHQIGGRGTELGPPLDSIGRKYDRAKLLESILQPSLQIDPKYAQWLVETKDGLVLSGLIIERNDKQLVLKDIQNKTHRLATSDIEGVFPQAKSIMPELLLRDFTAQQVADLLDYLGTQRAPLPNDPAASGS